MIFEELEAASGLLKYALERYVKACSAIQNHPVSRVFSNQLATELSRLSSYETEVMEVKAAIGRAKNYSSPLTTVNSLPSEILLRIFHLVLDAQDCYSEKRKGAKDRRLLKELDPLSHVCTRWRRVMLESPLLWTHIDFAQRNHRLLARARTYVARAGDLPLSVHIIDPTPSPDDFGDDTVSFEFLSSTARRISSLELVIHSKPTDFHRVVLQTYFTWCTPGTLTRVAISDQSSPGYTAPTLVESVESTHSSTSLLLDMSQEHLDKIWLPVTTLQLNGLYPHWTSKAYHGLVELSLISSGPNANLLTESQLLDILRSSPGLRILQLQLKARNRTTHTVATEPVPLNDLEVLCLSTSSFNRIGTFLRLIAPGSKSLDVCFQLIQNFNPPTQAFEDHARRFFARSNVARLKVRASSRHPWVARVLALLPRLEVLALGGFVCDHDLTPAPTPNQNNPSNPSHYIDALHVMCNAIDLVRFRPMVERYSIQSITFWNCKFSLNGEAISNEQTIQNNLSDICPTVQLLARDHPSLVESWD